MKDPEDRWAKLLCRELFQTCAQVKLGWELLPDPVYSDIVLIPNQPIPENMPGAGLFARYTGDRHCVIEPYSSSPDAMDLRTGMAKLQLVLREAYRKQSKPYSPVRGCLWILTHSWPDSALKQVFEQEGEQLEKGFWRWQGHEPVYVVHTTTIALREDTVWFRLFSRGRQRDEAIDKIVKEHLEPYDSLLQEVAKDFELMIQTEDFQKLSPEEIEEFKEILRVREEALVEASRQEGILLKAKEVAAQLLKKGFEVEAILDLTGLSAEQLKELQEPPVTVDDN